MARHEQDREDILREATALVERIELWLPDQPEPVVAGFRRDGSASFYFGADPVLQFNANGELRRGFDQGRMLKAEGGKLIVMRRVREDGQVSLYSHSLTPAESLEFTERAQKLLITVRESLTQGCARFGRQVPEGTDVVKQVRDWLETHVGPLIVADRPNV
jgi:hypothetical protein